MNKQQAAANAVNQANAQAGVKATTAKQMIAAQVVKSLEKGEPLVPQASLEGLMASTREQLTKEEVARIDANRRYWNRLAVTKPEHTTSFIKAGGFQGTSIKPMYSVLRMTETYGPCGQGWGWEEESSWVQEVQGIDPVVFVKGRIWYKEGDQVFHTPVATGGEQLVIRRTAKDGKTTVILDDEAHKKAQTDSMTKCMTFLGMSADIYLGRHKDKYSVTQIAVEVERKEKALEEARNKIKHEKVLEKAAEQGLAVVDCPDDILERINGCTAENLEKAAEWLANHNGLSQEQRTAALNALVVRRKELGLDV